MNRKIILTLTIALGLAMTLGVFAGLTLARVGSGPRGGTTGPTVVSYQGEVLVDGEPYTGTGYFKFAVVNATGDTTFWSNDGTSITGDEPVAAVDLPVADGVFSVLLGNPSDMEPLTADVFANRGRRLHVWFNTDASGSFTDLGTTVVAAVPYALNAETLDGLDGSYYDQHYENLIVVAKSGGDYTSISAAVDNISDNSESNRYLIWVAPGIYSETVTLKPYVSLRGAGAGTTVLRSFAYSSSLHADAATLTMAEHTTLRDMTVVVTGTGDNKVGVYVAYLPTDTVVIADVAVQATGGDDTRGIYNHHASPLIMDTSVRVEAITTSGVGFGITNFETESTIWNTIVHAEGSSAYGVYNAYNVGNGPVIRDTIATGEGLSNDGYGIYNVCAVSTIRGSTASGEGVSDGYGIYNYAGSTDPYTITIDSCQLSGSSFAVSTDHANAVMQVGSSLLDGGAGGSGTYHCAFTYDEAYDALDSDCQPIP